MYLGEDFSRLKTQSLSTVVDVQCKRVKHHVTQVYGEMGSACVAEKPASCSGYFTPATTEWWVAQTPGFVWVLQRKEIISATAKNQMVPQAYNQMAKFLD